MKRLILVLLVLVLLTGCGKAVKEIDLREMYRITIQISGYLSEMEGSCLRFIAQSIPRVKG